MEGDIFLTFLKPWLVINVFRALDALSERLWRDWTLGWRVKLFSNDPPHTKLKSRKIDESSLLFIVNYRFDVDGIPVSSADARSKNN